MAGKKGLLWVLLAVSVLALSGCSSSDNGKSLTVHPVQWIRSLFGSSTNHETKPAKQAPPHFSKVPERTVTYHCANDADIVAHLSTDKMTLQLNKKLVLKLRRKPAEHELKYAFFSNRFTIRGKDATLYLPGNRPLQCHQKGP